MSKKEEKWYVELGELAVDVILGLAHFAALAIPAVLIHTFIEWLTTLGYKGIVMTMLHGAELAFMAVDIYATCKYIYHKVKKAH